jgi:hypothetical protein
MLHTEKKKREKEKNKWTFSQGRRRTTLAEALGGASELTLREVPDMAGDPQQPGDDWSCRRQDPQHDSFSKA